MRLRGSLATLTSGGTERLAMITLRRTDLVEALQDLLQALDLSFVRFLLHLGVLEDIHDFLHLLQDMLKLEGDFPHLFNGLGHGTVPRRGGRLRRGRGLTGHLTLIPGITMLPMFPMLALVPMAPLFTRFPLGRRTEGLTALGPSQAPEDAQQSESLNFSAPHRRMRRMAPGPESPQNLRGLRPRSQIHPLHHIPRQRPALPPQGRKDQPRPYPEHQDQPTLLGRPEPLLEPGGGGDHHGVHDAATVVAGLGPRLRVNWLLVLELNLRESF